MRYGWIGVAIVAVAGVLWMFGSPGTPAPRMGQASKERIMKTDEEWK